MKQCEWCSGEIKNRRSIAKFCSANCRSKKYYREIKINPTFRLKVKNRSKEYYRKNEEKIKIYNEKYRNKNRVWINQKIREYKRVHKCYYNFKVREYKEKNRDKINEYNRIYRQSDFYKEKKAYDNFLNVIKNANNRWINGEKQKKPSLHHPWRARFAYAKCC